VAILIYVWLPEKVRRNAGIEWRGKNTLTSSGALICVRRRLWQGWDFETGGRQAAFSKFSAGFQALLYRALVPAA